MPDLINVANLAISFGKGAPVFKDLSFEIMPGECLGLVGPSGSGKSLTALALVGLLGRGARVSAGHVAYRSKSGNGHNLFELEEGEFAKLRGREIAYVAQDCQSALNPVITCGKQLREAVRNLRPEVKEVDREVRIQLDRVDLGNISDRILGSYPHQLSGGQLQRILIAMALVGRPRLLIADEPTTALDAITEMEIMQLMDRLRQELGMGMLLITHDTYLLQRVTNRIVRLKASIPNGRKNNASVRKEAASITPMRSSSPLLVQGLSISYGATSTRAVDDVTFQLIPGEYVALVGPSGCGKSTLAKWLVGLTAASNGTVTAGGKEISANVTGAALRGHTRAQLVFQDVLGSLNPSMPVGRAIEELCELHGHHETRELFTTVGLDFTDVGKRLPPELSGGQRQRVALMRALAAGPDFLICDEAVAALDDELKKDLQQLLKQTCTDRGVGILFISHDLREVMGYADRVLVMSAGKIMEEASPRKLIAESKSEVGRKLLRAAGLGQDK